MSKLHRFFIDEDLYGDGDITLTDEEFVIQIKKVLRLKNGDSVLLLDNSGKEYEVKIKDFNNSGVEVEVVNISENKNEPELKITLYQSLCKKDKFEWVLQKGTEIGVTKFIPVIANRSEKLGLNKDRADRILKEAAEQSERGIIPKLLEIQEFEEALKEAPTQGRSPDRIVGSEKIILDQSGEDIKNYKLVASRQSLSVYVGPEGGFTENELLLAKESGAKIVSLGSRVLRTETAGMVAVAILLNK